MQKDVHFYLTYALARKAGMTAKDAETIAWADQYTDDLTEAELYGIQTQVAIIGNWSDRQIQRSVLVPFHYIPGDDIKCPWLVTANNKRVRKLVETAPETFQFGIALHSLQDSFSHQGFTGWDEPVNACYPWYYIQSNIPNIGHAEMGALPDIANALWTDPRTGQLIDNKGRVLECAIATFAALCNWSRSTEFYKNTLRLHIEQIFHLSSYDQRKAALRELSGEKEIHYSSLNKQFQTDFHRQQFISSASQHLASATELMRDLSIIMGGNQ